MPQYVKLISVLSYYLPMALQSRKGKTLSFVAIFTLKMSDFLIVNFR